MIKNKQISVLAVILSMVFFILLTGISASEKFLSNIQDSLALKIGEHLYHSQKQGCATCHQANGAGGAKAGAANLQKSSEWKSTLIAYKARELGIDKESTRNIVIGLILNGAEKWNSEFYSRPKYSEIKDKIFFDKFIACRQSSPVLYESSALFPEVFAAISDKTISTLLLK